MEKLINILEGIKPGVDFKNENNLIEDGILDSFDIVTLVSMISQEYDIEFTGGEVVPENFKSVESINNVITKLQD